MSDPDSETRYSCTICQQGVGEWGPEHRLCLDCAKQQECSECTEWGPLTYCAESGCRVTLCDDCGPYCREHGEPLHDGLESGSWAGGFAANH